MWLDMPNISQSSADDCRAANTAQPCPPESARGRFPKSVQFLCRTRREADRQQSRAGVSLPRLTLILRKRSASDYFDGAREIALVGMERHAGFDLKAVLTAIGAELRRLHSDVLSEPIPERMAELLRQLDQPTQSSQDTDSALRRLVRGLTFQKGQAGSVLNVVEELRGREAISL
jgi:hypothetical protein